MASEHQGTPNAPGPQQDHHNNNNLNRPRLTDEETKVLKECENESFFKRALPLSCVGIFTTHYLVRIGKLSGHPKFGALPKSIIVGGLAYIVGKISYLPECRQKILERIPDSSLAMQIKKGHSGMQQQTDSSQGGPLIVPPDYGDKSSAWNSLPGNSPSYDGLRDSDRPSLDNEVKAPETSEEKKSTTYDDLRQKNRQEYSDSLSKSGSPPQAGTPSYKDSPYMPQKAWPDKPPAPPQEPPTSQPPKRKRTNIWGDVIED